MGKRLRRLFNSTTWSFLLLAAGVVLLAVMMEGFMTARHEARRPLFEKQAAEAAAREEIEREQPKRYVAPAEIEYPFF